MFNVYFAENKENAEIKIHINDQTEMEIVTQDVDEDNDDEKASEKVMTEEPAKVDDNALDQKSEEIQGFSHRRLFFELTLKDASQNLFEGGSNILRLWNLSFINQFLKKLHILASTASDRNCTRY